MLRTGRGALGGRREDREGSPGRGWALGNRIVISPRRSQVVLFVLFPRNHNLLLSEVVLLEFALPMLPTGRGAHAKYRLAMAKAARNHLAGSVRTSRTMRSVAGTS